MTQSATRDQVGADETRRAAEGVRELAREVAAELTNGAATHGWLLWEGIVESGHAIYKPPRPGFGHWDYTLSLVLCTDGTIVVTTGLSEGSRQSSNSMQSPNYSGRSGPAWDAELLYPDVAEWDWHESVEHAPARDIVDKHAFGKRFSLPLGGTLRQTLEAIRGERRSPQFRFPVAAPQSTLVPRPPRLLASGSWATWTLLVWLPFCAIAGTFATLLTRSWEVVDPRTELVPLSAGLSFVVAMGCALAVSAVRPADAKTPGVMPTLLVFGFLTFLLAAAAEIKLVIPEHEPWVTSGRATGALSVVHPVVVVLVAAVLTAIFVLFLAVQLGRPPATAVSDGRRKGAVGSFWAWAALGAAAFAALLVSGSGNPAEGSPSVQVGPTTVIRCTVLNHRIAAGRVSGFAPSEVQRGLRLCARGNRYIALHKRLPVP